MNIVPTGGNNNKGTSSRSKRHSSINGKTSNNKNNKSTTQYHGNINNMPSGGTSAIHSHEALSSRRSIRSSNKNDNGDQYATTAAAVEVTKKKKRRLVRVNITTCGARASGKSCLIKRFCEKRFESKYMPTIGIDYGVSPVDIMDNHDKSTDATTNNKDNTSTNYVDALLLNIRANFWDMSGDFEFLHVRSEFYENCIPGVFVLVYDISDRKSFAEMQELYNEAEGYGVSAVLNRNCTVCLCANKMDKQKARLVSESEGRIFASAHGLLYYEVSALNGKNVDEMFQKLIKKVLTTMGVN